MRTGEVGAGRGRERQNRKREEEQKVGKWEGGSTTEVTLTVLTLVPGTV